MRPIDQTMVSFLRVLREQTFQSDARGLATLSRQDLYEIFKPIVGSLSDFSEVMDLLFYNKLLDAESKFGPTFEGFFVTDFGIEFLRRPDQFIVDNGEVRRRKTIAVDATAWTGKQLILTDERVISELRIKISELRDKVYAMRIESNSDSQDIKGLVDSLVGLSGMASPDLGIIEKILAHPKFKLSVKLVAAVATIRGALGI